MMMNTPKGLILILHCGFKKITPRECLDALPENWKGLVEKIFEIHYSEKIDLPDLYEMAFNQSALEHRRQFSEEIKPYLDEHSDYTVVYFGMAAIPLAVDLGQLFNNYHNIEVFQWSHVKIPQFDGTKIIDDKEEMRWHQHIYQKEQKNNKVIDKGFLEKEQKGIVSALIRVSSSHPINPDDTTEVIENASELEVGFKNPDEDAITSPEVMNEIADRVKAAFDNISDNWSKINMIHLFASVPCGLAFLIGNKISPNNHYYVQTYQFNQTKNPKYRKALLIKAKIEAEKKLTEEDRETAKICRSWAKEELEKIKECYCPKNKASSNGREWYLGVINDLSSTPDQMWRKLTAVCDTTLHQDNIDENTIDVADGFKRQLNHWSFDDGFFVALNGRLKEESKIRQAIRLFLFHEILHQDIHKLDHNSGSNMGSFPKVLESADYQADVYAMLNEFSYQAVCGEKPEDERQFFLDLIKIATETMWSFDDTGNDLTEIQVRRLNRYLIWYRQHARIEKNPNEIDSIISVLWEKPVIEFNGLITKEESNRFYFILAKRPDTDLEIAVFDDNKIKRFGSTSAISFRELVEGIRKMDGETVLKSMRFN